MRPFSRNQRISKNSEVQKTNESKQNVTKSVNKILEKGVSKIPNRVKAKSRNKKIHKCEQCGKVFTEKRNLLRHIECVHSAKPSTFKCEACNITFSRSDNLRNHQKKNCKGMKPHKDNKKAPSKSLNCDKCDETFSSHMKLSQHKKAKHRNYNYVCKKCGKRYVSQVGLKTHNDISHLNISNLLPFHCSFCAEKFTRQFDLEKHMKKNH